jgi:hypothetical protein
MFLSVLVFLHLFNIIWDVLPDMMHITWGKWVIPMLKGELIQRNQRPTAPPAAPPKVHMHPGDQAFKSNIQWLK